MSITNERGDVTIPVQTIRGVTDAKRFMTEHPIHDFRRTFSDGLPFENTLK